MTSITTRVDGSGQSGVTVKGAPLTNSEIDQNFLSLNNNKLESTWTGNTSLVTLGTVTTGTWNATTIATSRGGTGLTSFTSGGAVYATSTSALTTGTLPIASGGTGITTAPSSGTLLIGTSTGGYSSATLTGTTNRVSVTNASGSITLSVPQDIATSSNVQFGSMGIGVATSGVSGTVYVNKSIGIGTAPSGTAGEIRATNAITSYYSDERLKENIEDITDALQKVMQIRGVTYTANQLAESFGYTNKEKQVGVLAGEVEQVLPEAVKPAPFDILRIDETTEISRSGQNYKTVQYEKLVPLLVQAIKELNEQVIELKKGR